MKEPNREKKEAVERTQLEEENKESKEKRGEGEKKY